MRRQESEERVAHAPWFHVRTIKGAVRDVVACSISQDGLLLATGELAGKVPGRIMSIARGEQLYAVTHDYGIYNVTWSPSDRELAATGSDGAVIIVTRPMHTSDAWTQRIAFKGDGSVFGCNFSPDGHYLAVGCSAGRVLLLDSATGYSAARFITGFEENISRVVFSPSGQYLAAGEFHSGTVSVLSRPTNAADDWTVAATFSQHVGAIRNLRFDQQSSLLLATSSDRSASVWQLPASADAPWPARPVAVLVGHTRSVLGGAFSADGHAITASEDGTVRLWAVDSGEEIGRIKAEGRIFSLSYNSLLGLLAAGLEQGMGVQLWRGLPGKALARSRIRKDLPAARLELGETRAQLTSAAKQLEPQIQRETEVEASIQRLRAQLAQQEAELAALQTPVYKLEVERFAAVRAKAERLEAQVAEWARTVANLEGGLAASGLRTLGTNELMLWLEDVGLAALQDTLAGLTGADLRSMTLEALELKGVSFVDAVDLQLCGALAEHPKVLRRAGLLAWDTIRTGEWLAAQDNGAFRSLASLNWTGACLVSLNVPRIVAAANDALNEQAAARLLALVETLKAQHTDTPGWSAAAAIADYCPDRAALSPPLPPAASPTAAAGAAPPAGDAHRVTKGFSL